MNFVQVINYKTFIRGFIFLAISLLFLRISSAQEPNTFSLIYNPYEVYAKVDEEVKIDIFLAENSESSTISLNLIAGPGIEITSINAPAGSYLSIGNNITDNIASMDVGKTDGNFSRNEKVATITFKMTESINSLIEIAPGSRVGEFNLESDPLVIFAVNEDGTVKDSENIPESIEDFSNSDLPEVPISQVGGKEDPEDFFTKIGKELNIDRNMAVVLCVSIVTIAIILVLFFIFLIRRPKRNKT